MGVKDYAILSDGTKYGNPKFLEKDDKKLATLQRKLSRTMKDSKRHEVARVKVARCHRRIRNRRSDFIHKLTTMLMKSDYDTFALEDLNIQGMMQNRHFARSIGGVAWNEFRRQLEYKAEWYGKNVIFIGRFEPSSKMCCVCGHVNQELTLSDRKWVCQWCGAKHDRDVNAAINIRNMAFAKENKIYPPVSGIMDGEGVGCEPVETSR